MGHYFVEVGIVCCSLSGSGIGEKVNISNYDAYEPRAPQWMEDLKADWRVWDREAKQESRKP